MEIKIYFCDLCKEKITDPQGFLVGIKPRVDVQQRDFQLCWGCGQKVMHSLGLHTDSGLVLITGKENVY